VRKWSSPIVSRRGWWLNAGQLRRDALATSLNLKCLKPIPTRRRTSMALPWKLHGDGRAVGAHEIVLPGERLTWPRTIGLGAQHIVAMFGATFLVPLLTGFPPTTTLLFSGVGTILFLLITRNTLPSYLGSSFAFIVPIVAATTAHGMPSALFGIVATGVLLAIVGLVVVVTGTRWIDSLMPPVVAWCDRGADRLQSGSGRQEQCDAGPGDRAGDAGGDHPVYRACSSGGCWGGSRSSSASRSATSSPCSQARSTSAKSPRRPGSGCRRSPSRPIRSRSRRRPGRSCPPSCRWCWC